MTPKPGPATATQGTGQAAGPDDDKIEDVPEGQDEDKDEPAGRDETKKEDKPAGPDGSHYYLLVDPRPGEAPDYDDSALVQCTGTGRSTVHPLDVMDNALYPQHLKDEGATRSDTEAQGAGLGAAVKGRAAEGATRSNTEAQGAGLGGAVKGRAAEGAMGSNTEDRGAGLGGTVLGGAGRSEDQDANDPRRDTQHAKAIDTEDITAKDNNAKDTNGRQEDKETEAKDPAKAEAKVQDEAKYQSHQAVNKTHTGTLDKNLAEKKETEAKHHAKPEAKEQDEAKYDETPTGMLVKNHV